jgi:aspartate/methionine/tyrosine aminotransferase
MKTPPLYDSVIEPSLICELTRLAETHHALNLGEGMPDEAPPAFVVEAFTQASTQLGLTHQAFDSWGYAPLRHAVADYYQRFYRLGVDAEQEVTITCGATEALYLTLSCILRPGDEVLMMAPYYESYPHMVRSLGGVPVFCELPEPHYTLEATLLEGYITPRTKALILTNPDNPTGRVRTRNELDTIAQVVQDHGLWCLADEVYDQYIYQPTAFPFIPMASLEGMKECTIYFGTTSKLLQATGWRVGWAVAPARLTSRIRALHDITSTSTSAITQAAATLAIQAFDAAAAQSIQAAYATKRTLAHAILVALGLSHQQAEDALPQGGWFCWFNAQHAFEIEDSLPWLKTLVTEKSMTLVPGACFSKTPVSPYVRLCFAKAEATLHMALQQLQ